MANSLTNLRQLTENSIVDDITLAETGARPFVYVCAFLSSMSSLLLGYECGVMAGAMGPIVDYMQLDVVEEGIIIGCVSIISVVGSLMAGRVADQLGRKMTIAIGSILFAAGALLSAAALDFWVLLIGRLITGVGVGFAFVIAPLYTSETSPSRYRGVLTSLTEFFIDCGILLGYLSNIVLANVSNEWRWMIGLGAAPAFIIMLSLLVMPESPRWLMMQGRTAEAEAALRLVYPEYEVSDTMAQIQSVIDIESKHGCDWTTILRPNKTLRLTMITGLGISFFQQATGNDAVVYYTDRILRDAGIVEQGPRLWATAGVGLCKTVFVIIPMLCADQLGRRFILLLGQSLMVLALLGMAAASSVNAPILAVTSLCGCMATFSMGIGPGTHIVGTEVFPLMMRGRIFSLALAINRFVSGTVAISFPVIADIISVSATFGIFTAVTALSVLFVYFLVPETSGKSLEEIQVFFRQLAGEEEEEEKEPLVVNAIIQECE
uniref:Major facilitator superfamily (MFS) profile domain-containing protein n=1 Tax=Eutreptiella gymnastica TaxID=73025 RepID=A0A7S4GIS9_9EUGL